MPDPVPTVLVNATGSPSLQMVWSTLMVPAVGVLCTVTVTNAAGIDSHDTPFNVDTVMRPYSVVAANPVGASYVAKVAPTIVFQVLNGVTELSQR